MPDDAGKLQAYLVRELIANLKVRSPGRIQATFRQRLCQKFYSDLNQLKPTHLLRAYEALCALDFPDPDTAALRDHVTRLLVAQQRLTDFRAVTIPGRERYQAKTPDPAKPK